MKKIELSIKPDFPKIEREVLDFWAKDQTFQKSQENRGKEFIFYDGPPFANGKPHYGHILTGYIKDTVARYKTMRGFKVERYFGWDCHGLPAEMAAEKDLEISGKKAIENFGIDKFNDYCRSSVMKFSQEWRTYIERQGRWVDMDNDYKTMDIKFMESVMYVFKKLHDKGLIYESERVMPYSWACETPLSNFETRLDNSYRQKTSKSVFVKVDLMIDSIQNHHLQEKINNLELKKLFAVIWTTTPWTLPSNLALAINSELDYTIVIDSNKQGYILSSNKAQDFLKIIDDNSKLSEVKIKGHELLKIKYKPIFDFFAHHHNAFQILNGSFVTSEEGTGIVHIAPAFGEDDFNLCKLFGITPVCPIDIAGVFTEQVGDLQGMNVLESNDKIIIQLKEKGLWLKTEQYIHNYPFCWRTDTPLIYRTVSSWYVKVTDIIDNLLKNNQQINWIPGHIKNGHFGTWLANARDWSISRNRFWGTPIPVWKSDNPAFPRIDVYGSIAELEKDFNCTITDLHRPFIDNLTRPNPDDPSGKSKMVRIPDIFDCWFESGAMPYGQWHYPFENQNKITENFPADFIVEYISQTRGWFYTLHVLSTALFNKPAFTNVICHGVILATDGKKLSKRLGNYTDPLIVMDEYGSDALRFAMLSSNVVSGGNLHIHKDARDVKEAQKLIIKPLWNAFYFLYTYITANKVEIAGNFEATNILDKFILAEMNNLFEYVTNKLDEQYLLENCCKKMTDFLQLLNNWYIRRSKKRFWQNKDISDLQCAHEVLFYIIKKFTELTAAFLPFITEFIYFQLQCLSANSVHVDNYQSVHLQILDNDAKVANFINSNKDMHYIMNICSGALAIRNTCNISVKQVLQKLQIFGLEDDNRLRNRELMEILSDEINVKDCEYVKAANFSDFITQEPKINFSHVAKKIPQKIKNIMQDLKNNNYKIEGEILYIADEQLILNEDYTLNIKPKDKDAKNILFLPEEQRILVLNIDLDEQLMQEGVYRNILRAIQEVRKKSGLKIHETANCYIETDNVDYIKCLTNNISTLQIATSIQQLFINETLDDDDLEEFSIDILQEKITLYIKKI